MAALHIEAGENGTGLKLNFSCVRSILVGSATNRTNTVAMRIKARRADVSRGEIDALKAPIRGMWLPGDVCSIFEAPRNVGYLFVLVQQHLRRAGERQRMELLCIPIEDISDVEGDCFIRFDRRTRELVTDVCISRPVVSTAAERLCSTVPSFGKLQDGRLYFIDNILLYSDGFSQYNFKQGSAGGIYALSLNYSPSLRRGRERVRTLALTPPGICTMEGLRHVIDDLVTSSTTGTRVMNADGEEMILFTNVVGYVADYHETSYALDVTGQNGKAPCHLCAFLRYDGHPNTASQYAGSNIIHSSDTCYARMGPRTEFIRESCLRDEDLISIGLNPQQQADKKNSPLHELSRKMRKAVESVEIPLTAQNVPVVTPKFDPYRSVLVSPDHVLFGVAVNALNFAFSALPSRDRKEQVDVLISNTIRRNGLAKESEIYNFNRSAMHAASISTRFCTLLVSPDIFKEVFEDCEAREEASFAEDSLAMSSFRNLTKLRDLVSATYWYPDLSTDGSNKLTKFNSNNGRTHLAKLESLSVDYIKNLNNTCKLFPEARRELDKPNVHRVLELYKHSIPAMGHVRHFAELVFEKAHQPLKRAMLRSNFRNSQLQSSRTAIADDWKRRLQCVMNETMEYDVVTRGDAREREIVMLFCGRRDDVVNFILSKTDMTAQASAILRSHALRTLLNSKPSKLNNTDHFWKWTLTEPVKMRIDDSRYAALMSSVSEAREIARSFLIKEGGREVQSFARASRVLYSTLGDRLYRTDPKAHDTLHRGTVLQAWVEDEHAPCLFPYRGQDSHDKTLRYFAVENLVRFGGSRDGDSSDAPQSYAVVRLCKNTDEGCSIVIRDPNGVIQLLVLNDGVRRVGIAHACNSDGDMTCMSLKYNCDASLLLGHWFYYYGRDNGYPPRMA